MKADPAAMAKRLRQQRRQAKSQVEAMTEQLAIADAIADEYDELINALDQKTVPLVSEINTTITAVKDAYDARITAGCLSPLIWQLQATDTVSIWDIEEEIQTWKVVKDPAQREQLNYYGCKYYRYPKNREYGSNVIDEIQDASIDPLTSVLVIFDSNGSDYTGVQTSSRAIVKVGDILTDDLEDPVVFQTGNLPIVTGLGTANYPKVRVNVSGFCTGADNKVYSDATSGKMSQFAIGDVIFSDFFPAGTVIESFGTSVASLDLAGGYSNNVSIDFAVMSNVSLGTTSSNIFSIGKIAAYPAIFFDTQTSIGASHASFLVVRGPDNRDLVFESTKNPIDPVEIGIADGSGIGKGHKIDLINNGDPKQTKKWHEVREEEEPPVGAGFAEYWVGASSWPTLQDVDRDGDGGDPASGGIPYTYSYATATYAVEGQTLTVGVGGTEPSAIMGTTAVSPNNPSLTGCGDLTSAISSRESEMSAKISENTPKINKYLDGTKIVRELRTEEETTAWGMLQGIAFVNDKRQKQKDQAKTLEDFDWDDVGI
ncbi:MAG: hypothetical protein CL855_08510 [Cryomorphaceae bacterium]|nr:hypothetical protein [Cryomorphaceae bacterium]